MKRRPHGEFTEVHQPLGGIDADGHPVELAYQGAKVPKRMNDLGAADTPVKGGWFRPDPVDQQNYGEHGRDPLQVEPGEDRETAGRPRDIRD